MVAALKEVIFWVPCLVHSVSVGKTFGKSLGKFACFKATFVLTLGRAEEYRTRANTKMKIEGARADRPGY